MPTFRTTPSQNLSASIRRLVGSKGGRSNPLEEIQVDNLAAQTARNSSLAEKARAEVDAMRAAETARADPAVSAEYASHVAGLDVPTGKRLSDHIRGVMEQPSVADQDDAAIIGAEAKPYVTGAPNVDAPSKRLFQSALASTIANRIATGKTNAPQLAQAGDRVNETALTNEAANTASAPDANRIIAAVSGKLREPFRTGAQGQVVDRETGDVYDNTVSSSVVARNNEVGALARERAAAVKRGEANKGGARASPQQVERWVSETARKEWDAIPAKERRGMNYEQHLDKVRERFKTSPATGKDKASIEDDAGDALKAINGGAPSKAVRKRFKERWGVELIDSVPDASDAGLGAGENALDEED